MIVTTDVHWFSLGSKELTVDFFFVSFKLFGNFGELVFQDGILVLRGQCLSPVKSQVIMASTVVNLSDFAGRRLVVVKEFGNGKVKGFSQYLGFFILVVCRDMLE